MQHRAKRRPITGHIKKGALHSDLGVPQDEPIPTGKIEAAKARAKKSGNAELVKRTTFALNARKWNH